MYLYKNLFLDSKGKPVLPNINSNIKRHILAKLLTSDFNINFNDLSWKDNHAEPTTFDKTGFFLRNTARIDEDGTFKDDFFAEIYDTFEKIKAKHSDIDIKIEEEVLNDDSLDILDKDTYRIETHHTMRNVYYSMYISEGFCRFKHNFEAKALSKQTPTNITTLQRFEIKINSKIRMYDHLAKLHYECPGCGHQFFKSYKELESTNMKTECPNVILDGAGKPRTCKKALSKPTVDSKVVNINIYDATILGESGEPENILVESMELLEPFIYDAVGFRLQDAGEKYLFILDFKPIEGNNIDFTKFEHFGKDGKFIERHAEDEDIIPQWFEFLDKNIYELCGDEVLGMQDIKFALLVQKICHTFHKSYNNFNLNNNIALLGENDSGKTWTFERYGYLLYGGTFKVTNGENVSIPALRGSSKSNRDIRKGNKNVPGMLTLFNSILIDEIDQNPENIMAGLKPTLNKATFSNDKADGDKTEYARTCNVNITENIQMEHVGMMQGMVKKEYENLQQDPSFKNPDYPERFNYDWDIFQHLEMYVNTVLREAIDIVRKKYANEKSHFLDGREHAVHDRFPFWYVMRNKTSDSEIVGKRQDAVINRMFNHAKVETFIAVNKILQQLTVDNINDLFKALEPFIEIKYNAEIGVRLKAIVEEFDTTKSTASRTMEILTVILNCSRMLNLRHEFAEVDYNYVKRYLFMRDRICTVDELDDMSQFKGVTIDTEKAVEEFSDFEKPDEDFQEFC